VLPEIAVYWMELTNLKGLKIVMNSSSAASLISAEDGKTCPVSLTAELLAAVVS